MRKPDVVAKWQRYREAGCKALSDGNFIKAEGLLSIALRQAEQCGRDDLRLAVSLQDMAEYYCLKGQYQPAEALYSRCLAIKKRMAGREHPNVVQTKERLHEVRSLLNSR